MDSHSVLAARHKTCAEQIRRKGGTQRASWRLRRDDKPDRLALKAKNLCETPVGWRFVITRIPLLIRDRIQRRIKGRSRQSQGGSLGHAYTAVPNRLG